MPFCEFTLDRFFEGLKIFGEYGESGCLTVSAECDEIFATVFEEIDDTDMFGTSTACYQLPSLVLESDRRLPEGLGETSGDESDNPVLDIARVVEEDSFVPIDYFQRMLDEMLCGRFPLTIEVFEFRENRIKLVFSGKEEGKSFVGAIHPTGSIDTGSDMEPHDIRVHILVFPFYELPEPAGVARFQSLEPKRCDSAVLSYERHAVGDGSETGKVHIFEDNALVGIGE